MKVCHEFCVEVHGKRRERPMFFAAGDDGGTGGGGHVYAMIGS